MDLILRTVGLYIFLLVLLRLSGGKRSLAQITTMDFILLLIISEVTQQALTGNDYSLTNSLAIILTLVGLDIAFTLFKQHSSRLELWLEGTPLIVVQDGKPFDQRLRKARLDHSDVLQAARQKMGLEQLEQIKYAVLEKDGSLTVIPQSLDPTGPGSSRKKREDS